MEYCKISVTMLQARILYSDQVGRVAISERFNTAIAEGRIQGTIVISRDHHDVRYNTGDHSHQQGSS